ncbi:STAS domain-containing protein [Sutcliffiella deserti]|uniref:STAS domain-containing protein n=1 Tax=Sutcliffiella deserti TaxID=2875501 RepID=UPI001CBED183|nr:STAS domain-containing protein [Sutcliffiella deserti]
MTLMLKLSDHLIQNAEALALEVVDNVLQRMNLHIPREEKDQAVAMYVEFLKYLGDEIVNEEENIPDFLIEWSKKNALRQVSPTGKISDIVLRYGPTRIVFIDIMTRISIEFGLSIKDHAFILKRINAMLDSSLNATVLGFERLSEEFKEKTNKELAILSAPIVPVKSGVVILPFIGEIDHSRATYIKEHVIPKIAMQDVNWVIADFSGINTIDRENALHLHEIGNMLRLMGIKIITTGMHPETARAAVQAGVNLSSVKSFVNVKTALESI